MFARIVVTALIAGVVGGVFAWSAHMLSTAELIRRAEVYEQMASTGQTPTTTAAGHHHGGNAGHEGHAAGAAGTVPAGDAGRDALTLLTEIIVAVGFAFLLTGAFVLSGAGIGWRRGIVWGLAGFAAFSVSPALGLAPELPGMAGADLEARQIWWIAAAVSAAAGLALIFFAGQWFVRLAGAGLIAVPHIVGAPTHEAVSGLLPAQLAAEFAVLTLVTAGLFWMVLGAVAGFVYERLEPAQT